MAMKKIRKHAKKLLILIAIFIIPAFVLWGAGSALRGRGGDNYAGKIFGKKVSLKEYSKSWNECRNQALMLYGQNLEKIAPLLNLEQQAWERLILLKKAKKERIKVNDEEIIKTIKQFPFFHKESEQKENKQKKKKFDKETYKTILKYAFRTTPKVFEEQIKNSLIIQKLIKKVLKKIDITDKEIKKAYRDANEKVKVSYILFDAKNFENKVNMDSEKIKKYYQENKNKFKLPPKVKVKYIPITYKSVEETVKITDEEISDYFKEHKEEFVNKDENEPQKKENNIKLTDKTKNKIKNILSAQKAKQNAEMKAEEISEFLIRTPDLDKAGKNFSLPVKETIYFSLNEPIPEIGWSQQFSQKAFSMEKEEISDMIRLYKKGLYFIEVLEKKRSYIPEFDKVKQKVESRYKTYKGNQLAKDTAEEKLKEIKKYITEGMVWEKALNKTNLESQTSKFFKRNDYVKDIGQNKNFISASFSTEIGKLYKNPIPIRKGYCLLKPEAKKDIDEKKFEKEKEDFKKKHIAKVKQQYYREWLNKLIQKANLENNLDNLRKKRDREKGSKK